MEPLGRQTVNPMLSAPAHLLFVPPVKRIREGTARASRTVITVAVDKPFLWNTLSWSSSAAEFEDLLVLVKQLSIRIQVSEFFSSGSKSLFSRPFPWS